MRRIPNLLRCVVLTAPWVVGCSSGGETPAGAAGAPEARFADTTESQQAVFFTAPGHVGGPGAADVMLDPAAAPAGRRATVNGKQLLLTPESWAAIEERLPRPTPAGARYILVGAKVRVEERSGRVSTNPPSTQSYQGVVIEELTRVEWHTPPAK